MIAIPEIEADAIRWRLRARDEAQQALDRVVAQVLERVGAAPDAQVRLLPDGGLAAVAPPEPPDAGGEEE